MFNFEMLKTAALIGTAGGMFGLIAALVNFSISKDHLLYMAMLVFSIAILRSIIPNSISSIKVLSDAILIATSSFLLVYSQIYLLNL